MITVALALLGYAATLAIGLPRVLAQAAWPSRAPAAGLLLWQAANLSTVLSFTTAVGLTTLPLRPLWHTVDQALHACMSLIRATYCPSNIPRPLAAFLGLLLLVMLLRICLVGFRQHRRTSRWRREHRRLLDLLAHDTHGIAVIPHPVPAVYTLPGRHPRVVMTSATTTSLTREQRAAALAHERAHITGHHDVLIRFASTLERALPGIPLFRAAREQTARLAEMIADDHAATRAGRESLIGALVSVACTPTTTHVLHMSGGDTLERVQRLLTPVDTATIAWRYGIGALAALLIAFPALAVVLPVVITATRS
jgi:Zn-dependent protease with chaperone function